MKFIHIADIHLGATPDSNMPWGPQREKEIWTSFQDIVRICNEEKADLLLIAGDMFHRQPLVRELKEVNYILSRLETAKAVIMAGNHDYIGPRSYYQDFTWDEKIHFFLQDNLEVKEYEELGAEVYGLSFRSKDITEPLYDGIKPKQNNKIHILLAHGGDERNIPMNRKKLAGLGFDYIALGHIHKPEFITEKIAYCGSLEPLDKNELGERGYIIGEISLDSEGKVQTSARFVPHSLRQYKRRILNVTQDTTNGSLQDQAREIMKECGTDHIYSFTIQGVRDETIHFDKELLRVLGNVLEIEDQSVPDYDFDALYKENSDNVIGMFIRKIRESAGQDEVARKALYYGIEALLNAKE
jgi:DNA repair exonuclease SbcCD nuclease subunit